MMTEQAISTSNPLQFRRQFLLARGPVSALSHWPNREIGPYRLYNHPDLALTTVSEGGRTLVLLGYWFDAERPELSNEAILQQVATESGSFEVVIRTIKNKAGRFVLIYLEGSTAKLVQDALALREVYYCTAPNLVVCASQPNLVVPCSNPKLSISDDPVTERFYSQDMGHVRNRSLWVGDGTYYMNLRHLLPNHALDLNTLTAARYWPNAGIPRLELEHTVEKSCRFLQGMMQAVTQRHSVMMAVTSGTDSRTLLAASRSLRDRIYFFINQERTLTGQNSDIAIPSRIFERIGVPFHVHRVPAEVDEGFRQTLLGNTFFASERILPTIYNVYHQIHPEKINILGVGEIGRALWGHAPKDLNAYYLAYALRYKSSPYATRACERWLREVGPVAERHNLDIMTMLLWEQLLGNWGAVGNSESDIAIEEFDPFDSHYLYETLLGADERSIGGDRHVIFREMLRNMWPELLGFPINPPDTPRKKLVFALKKIGFYPLLKKAKYRSCLVRNRDLLTEACAVVDSEVCQAEGAAWLERRLVPEA
jgi:hypothetical protein